jgi:hypothetical protein
MPWGVIGRLAFLWPRSLTFNSRLAAGDMPAAEELETAICAKATRRGEPGPKDQGNHPPESRAADNATGVSHGFEQANFRWGNVSMLYCRSVRIWRQAQFPPELGAAGPPLWYAHRMLLGRAKIAAQPDFLPFCRALPVVWPGPPPVASRAIAC